MTTILLRRARPLLGTLVSIQVRVDKEEAAQARALAAIEAAFVEVDLMHCLMSAHAQDSDLARLAAATAGEQVHLHPHTRAVLRLAQHWCRASGGAFDAQAAGERLAQAGLRPGLAGRGASASARFLGLDLSHDQALSCPGPLRLDLGGLAKGYAVDQAVRVLREQGVSSGLVNAGGDLRAFGPASWPIEVEHPGLRVRTRRLLRLREGAVASSSRWGPYSEFITTRRRSGSWSHCTVLARDCASADALTKWALQARDPALQLRMALSRQGGRMWRD